MTDPSKLRMREARALNLELYDILLERKLFRELFKIRLD